MPTPTDLQHGIRVGVLSKALQSATPSWSLLPAVSETALAKVASVSGVSVSWAIPGRAHESMEPSAFKLGRNAW